MNTIINGRCSDLSILDPFFNSFKLIYPSFNIWFKKSCNEDRLAYYSIDDKTFSIEALSIIRPIKKNDQLHVKICSFKINNSSSVRGLDLLHHTLLKIKEHYPNCSKIYLTVPCLDSKISMFFLKHGFEISDDRTHLFFNLLTY